MDVQTTGEVSPMQYHLWLLDGDSRTLLATAPGSTFWTEIWKLAKATYGAKSISITFQ